MSDQKIYEGTFQYPTKGEKISLSVFGFFFVITAILSAIEITFIFFPIMFGFTLLMIGPLAKKIRKTCFANVYQDRVESGSTFFRTRTARIEASKIESVSFGQSILGKSDYGNVVIGGSGGMKIRIQNIVKPDDFVSAVRSISSAPIQKSSGESSNSAAKEIQELNKLLESGVISQEDFEKGKNRALGL